VEARAIVITALIDHIKALLNGYYMGPSAAEHSLILPRLWMDGNYMGYMLQSAHWLYQGSGWMAIIWD
jgi:hypothetical protein